MNRVFRSDRLYRLLKLLVGIVTVLSFLSSILFYRLLSKGYLLKAPDNCVSGDGYTILVNCGPDMAMLEKWNTYLWKSIYIGLLAPVLFYFGVILLNYLFPINKKYKIADKK